MYVRLQGLVTALKHRPFCRPAHALYFATYELSKDRLGGNRPGHQPLATAAAGSLATVVNDGIMTPADVVKQRLQVNLNFLSLPRNPKP